jgi:hypothetical protein
MPRIKQAGWSLSSLSLFEVCGLLEEVASVKFESIGCLLYSAVLESGFGAGRATLEE